ncbi:DUF1801 domain-containing protein [Asticcacaulis sp. 201]|uniref:DUF1801 domain-containing protein n=1 Tax=Asticcacaulis sp. 201 TaxID=3028787 RepID=UPI002916E579|nr:DUF1801 domain-containing protein [Asticcacaulis sp. 201]MDV6332680.1 DUF1801 domain-containing protein [Asticcacaulis sp. 201]
MPNLKAESPLPDAVTLAFAAFSEPLRGQLLRIRRLILEVAETTLGVGPLTETLKWGEPAYLTNVSRSGSTIRLGASKSADNAIAVLFNCRTTLVDTFRAQFPDVFAYQGNRAILISASASLPESALAICLVMALTYHRQTK